MAIKTEMSLVENETTQTYEQKRLLYKNSTFAAICIFFKGTVGLGLLVNQYYLAKAGLILGPLLTIIVTILITYTILLILRLANRIEHTRSSEFKFETMDELVEVVLGRFAKIMTKICTFLLNQATIIVNAINFSKFIRNQAVRDTDSGFLADLHFYKLITIAIFLLLMGTIVEPERLKYPAYISAAILFLGISMLWFNNGQIVYHQGGFAPLNYFNVYGISSLVGSQLYSFESIGIVFGIRATLKHPHHMKRVLVITFFGIALLFVYNGVSFLTVSL